MFRCFYFGIFLLSALIGMHSCAKREPIEPVSESSIAGIDPDQKALPRDEPVAVPERPVTDVTLDGAGGEVAPGPETVPSVAPETASSDRSTPAGGGADADRSDVGSDGFTGSGPQTRYIKASELNIRSQPNRHSKIVGHLKGGDGVRVKINGGWARLDEGRWIRSRWLVKKRPSSFVNGADDSSQAKASTKRSKARAPRGKGKK